MTEQDIDSIFATNVKGTMLSVKAAIPALATQRARTGDHHLVDHRPDHRLSRLVALRGHQGGSARLPAHGGDRARQARRITVNAVLPGNIVTEGLDDAGRRSTARRWSPRSRSNGWEPSLISAMRRCSSPPTRPAYITGQTIVVDGGQILPESMMALEDE